MARLKGPRAPDRTEARARTLAIEAGIDPDSRIEKPGDASGRGMPAWIQFRDAARQEMQKEHDDLVSGNGEKTLAIVRADAVENRQHVHVRKHIEDAGFHILTSKRITEESPECGTFLDAIEARNGYAFVVTKENAVADWLELIPAIEKASGDHLPQGSLYGSATVQKASYEIGLLFQQFMPSPAIVDQAPEYASAGLTVFGNPDEGTLRQIHTCMAVGNVVGAVLCADAHVGYAQPVGGVIAMENMISMHGVGTDIGCGNDAIRTSLVFGDVKNRVDTLALDLARHLSFGLGRRSKKRVEHELLDDDDAWYRADVEFLRKKAVDQLGTIGSGNHYVDLFYEVPVDPNEPFDRDKARVWIGIHHGSRGLGYGSFSKYARLAGGKDGMFIAPTILRTDTELGQRYIAAMQLAGRYAYAGREAVANEVCRILGTRKVDYVRNHHNWAFEEEHNGRKLWVVRKGATPAFPGQRGFVGGSMGDDAVIIEGVDSEKSRASFYSTIHGAGRVMSRSSAKKTFTRHQMQEWLNKKGVTLVGGGLDESPMAYRRLDEVLKHHEGTIKVNHRLRPFLVAMAGDDVYDPYKD